MEHILRNIERRDDEFISLGLDFRGGGVVPGFLFYFLSHFMRIKHLDVYIKYQALVPSIFHYFLFYKWNRFTMEKSTT